jgi:hypothetical protein
MLNKILKKINAHLALRKKKSSLKRKILEEDISYSEEAKNIINSISKSKSLYKELITKVHPDIFADVDDKQKATELSSSITENKHNYNELSKLKKEVHSFLKSKE